MLGEEVGGRGVGGEGSYGRRGNLGTGGWEEIFSKSERDATRG